MGERAQRASDLRQEERRRRREVAQVAQAQSERRAKVAEVFLICVEYGSLGHGKGPRFDEKGKVTCELKK